MKSNQYNIVPEEGYPQFQQGQVVNPQAYQGQPILLGTPLTWIPNSNSNQQIQPSQTAPYIYQGIVQDPKNQKVVDMSASYERIDETNVGTPDNKDIYEAKLQNTQQMSNQQNVMINNVPQMPQIGAQMFGQVVYDPTLLYKINSREAQLALCQACNKYVQTVVKYEIGVGTVISSSFIVLIGGVACFWIPCCLKDLKDAVHHCPCCAAQLGKVKFIAK
jgi:lipopolysaccharide-induced tumor necrosis factor-alpha factor